MARRGSANQVVVIYWRDIPTQVNGIEGRERHQYPLKPRFEKAADRAAMRAGLSDANSYVGEVRREARKAGADPRAEAEALAAELDATFTLDVLNSFVDNGGHAPGDDTNQLEGDLS